MARVCAITTIDNPYNPITDFENWYFYDCLKGYGTCAYLSRVALTSDSLSDKDNDLELERAIDEIVDIHTINGEPFLYKKVVEIVEDPIS